jgi:hypothetical protein
MTRDKAQKTAIRQRMAQTGEPYSVARHVIEGEQRPAALMGRAERIVSVTHAEPDHTDWS